MHKTLLSVFLIVFTLSAQAQISKTYVPGYYFDNSGRKFTGTMIFNAFDDRFLFKATPEANPQKIKIEEVTALQSNGDSVTVLTEDAKDNRKYFAGFKMATPVTRFYYKYILKQKGTGAYNGNPEFYRGAGGTLLLPQPKLDKIKQTIMYQEGNTTFELTKGNYIEVLSKAFADVPEVVKLIQAKELKFNDMDEIFSRYYVKTKYNGK